MFNFDFRLILRAWKRSNRDGTMKTRKEKIPIFGDDVYQGSASQCQTPVQVDNWPLSFRSIKKNQFIEARKTVR